MRVEIVSGIISLFVSLTASLLYDRFYPLFHSMRKKVLLEDSAPQMFSCKCAEMKDNQNSQIKNNQISKIFKFSIITTLNEEGGHREERVNGRFEEVNSIGCMEDNQNAWGIRIWNSTNRGLTLNLMYSKDGQIIDLSFWKNRHIDANECVILLFNIRDKPLEITATYDGHPLVYTLTIDSDYINPKCSFHSKKRKHK